MAQIKIASVRLTSGHGSYFDELTRIHLTMGNPIGDIYSGMNLTNIRRAIKSGRLSLISGTLGPNPDSPKLVVEDGQYKLSIPKHKPKDNKIEKAFDNFVKTAGKNMIEKIREKKNNDKPVEEIKIETSEESAEVNSETATDTTVEKIMTQNFSKSKKKKKHQEKSEAE